MKIKNFLITPLFLSVSMDLSADNLPTPKSAEHLPDRQFDVTSKIEPERLPPLQADNTGGESVNVTSEQLIQDPVLLNRALVSAVLNRQIDAIRILLPIYLQLPEQDTFLLLVSRAMLERADGRYDSAIDLYRRALAENNNVPMIRFTLAQTLFENHDNQAAKDQLTRLRSDSNLPFELHEKIDNYLTALNKRSQWDIYGGLSYVQDDNINNAKKQRYVYRDNGVWTLPQAESAHGIFYQLGAERDWPLKGHWNVRSGVDFDGKLYWDNRSYDETNLRVNLGGVYKTARFNVNLLRRILVAIIGDFPREKRFPQEIKQRLIQAIDDFQGFKGIHIICSWLLFSGNQVGTFEELYKKDFWNCMRRSDVPSADGWFNGFEVTNESFHKLLPQFKDDPQALFVLDPPYLCTRQDSYKQTRYFDLIDFLRLIHLTRPPYIFFSSTKSEFIRFIDWMVEDKHDNWETFDNVKRITVNATVSYNGKYEDNLVYKF